MCIQKSYSNSFKLVLQAWWRSWAQITKNKNKTKPQNPTWPERSFPPSWWVPASFVQLVNKFHPFYTASVPFVPELMVILSRLFFGGVFHHHILWRSFLLLLRVPGRLLAQAGELRLSTSLWVKLGKDSSSVSQESVWGSRQDPVCRLAVTAEGQQFSARLSWLSCKRGCRRFSNYLYIVKAGWS